MPKGNLVVRLMDLAGEPARGRVHIDLRRVEGEPGAGGESMEVSVGGPVSQLTITGITCRSGPGTLYRLRATTDHFRPYSFFQQISEDRNNTASDDVEFWIRPGDVSGIRAAPFDGLPAHVRSILENASMQAIKTEDEDLVGASGSKLYERLGSMRKACLLNIVKKASDAATAANCLDFIDALLLCRQDRFFARVDSAFPEHLRRSAQYKSAEDALHEPLPGFELAEGSFKSRDAHANLQVTFMRNTMTGGLAADIDIDESSGIEHGFEVIRNAAFRNRTNPYLIREFMLSADPIGRSLDPGYRLVF